MSEFQLVREQSSVGDGRCDWDLLLDTCWTYRLVMRPAGLNSAYISEHAS